MNWVGTCSADLLNVAFELRIWGESFDTSVRSSRTGVYPQNAEDSEMRRAVFEILIFNMRKKAGVWTAFISDEEEGESFQNTSTF